MDELKNEFIWSLSRDRHFRGCKRLFYLSHYAHWGGWRHDADDLSKLCYRLTKMKNLDMWVGEIVHRVIHETLVRVGRGQPVHLEEVTSRAVTLLRSGWKQSKHKQWELDPKRTVNLFEHYYHLEVSRDRADEVKERALSCLKSFMESMTFQIIQDTDPSNWMSLEEFQSFTLQNFQVFLKMDLALEREGSLYIYDWKTGEEHEDDMMQLAIYALYGMRVWGFPIERIKIILAYLRTNDFQEHDLSPSLIIEAQDRILKSCLEIRSLLTDPEANVASMENFPMTIDRWKCRRCFFWQVCYGHRRIQTSP